MYYFIDFRAILINELYLREIRTEARIEIMRMDTITAREINIGISK